MAGPMTPRRSGPTGSFLAPKLGLNPIVRFSGVGREILHGGASPTRIVALAREVLRAATPGAPTRTAAVVREVLRTSARVTMDSRVQVAIVGYVAVQADAKLGLSTGAKPTRTAPFQLSLRSTPRRLTTFPFGGLGSTLRRDVPAPIEMRLANTTNAEVAAVAREALHSNAAPLRSSALAREAVHTADGPVRVIYMVREVMRPGKKPRAHMLLSAL